MGAPGSTSGVISSGIGAKHEARYADNAYRRWSVGRRRALCAKGLARLRQDARAGCATPLKGVSPTPWRLPALHPSFTGGMEKGTGSPRALQRTGAIVFALKPPAAVVPAVGEAGFLQVELVLDAAPRFVGNPAVA